WPYATTLFDYIRRAMPLPESKSLKDEEVYALAAFILAQNKIIGEDDVMDAKSLPQVKMPNREGFVRFGRGKGRPSNPRHEPRQDDDRQHLHGALTRHREEEAAHHAADLVGVRVRLAQLEADQEVGRQQVAGALDGHQGDQRERRRNPAEVGPGEVEV